YIVRADRENGHLVRELGDTAMESFQKYDIDLEHWRSYFDNMSTDLFRPTATDSNGYPECFWGSLPVFKVTDASRRKALVPSPLVVHLGTEGICVSESFEGPGKGAPKAPGYLGVADCPVSS
ncbi:hypothetical protein QBC41DRAFT_390508, partial [Cercophora samala]